MCKFMQISFCQLVGSFDMLWLWKLSCDWARSAASWCSSDWIVLGRPQTQKHLVGSEEALFSSTCCSCDFACGYGPPPSPAEIAYSWLVPIGLTSKQRCKLPELSSNVEESRGSETEVSCNSLAGEGHVIWISWRLLKLGPKCYSRTVGNSGNVADEQNAYWFLLSVWTVQRLSEDPCHFFTAVPCVSFFIIHCSA